MKRFLNRDELSEGERQELREFLESALGQRVLNVLEGEHPIRRQTIRSTSPAMHAFNLGWTAAVSALTTLDEDRPQEPPQTMTLEDLPAEEDYGAGPVAPPAH